MKSYRLILKALALLAFAIGAASCHTMHGFGQDVQDTGSVIEDAAH